MLKSVKRSWITHCLEPGFEEECKEWLVDKYTDIDCIVKKKSARHEFGSYPIVEVYPPGYISVIRVKLEEDRTEEEELKYYDWIDKANKIEEEYSKFISRFDTLD